MPFKSDKHRRFMYANAGKNGMPTKQELSHWKTHKNGGPPYETETTEEVNKDAMDGMMKARIAYEAMHGNPAALRMIAPVDNPYDFGNSELGTHYMSSYDNYAIPNIQDVNGTLDFTGPRMEEAIKFDRPEDAIYFAKNYKKVAPIFNKKYKGDRIKHYGGNIPEHYHPHMNDPSKEAYYSTLDEKFANEKENFINYLNHPFYQQNAQTAWGDDAALNIQKQIDRINNTDIRHESNALMNYAHGTGTRGLYMAPEEKEGRGEIILRKQPGGSGELHTIGHEIGHASDVSPVESGRSTEYFPVQKQMYPEFSGYYPENLSLDSSYVNDPQYKEYLELPTEFRTRLNHVKQLMAEDNFNWNEKTGEEISEWLQQNNYNYGKYHELAGNNRMMLGNNALQEVDQISKYNLEDQIRYSDTYGDMYRNYANKDWRKEKKKEGNKHYQKAWRKGIRTPEQWLDHFNFVPEDINPKELLEDKDMDGVPDMQYQIDPSMFKKKQNPEFLEHVFKELAQQQANPNQPQIAEYGSYLYDNGGPTVFHNGGKGPGHPHTNQTRVTYNNQDYVWDKSPEQMENEVAGFNNKGQAVGYDGYPLTYSNSDYIRYQAVLEQKQKEEQAALDRANYTHEKRLLENAPNWMADKGINPNTNKPYTKEEIRELASSGQLKNYIIGDDGQPIFMAGNLPEFEVETVSDKTKQQRKETDWRLSHEDDMKKMYRRWDTLDDDQKERLWNLQNPYSPYAGASWNTARNPLIRQAAIEGTMGSGYLDNYGEQITNTIVKPGMAVAALPLAMAAAPAAGVVSQQALGQKLIGDITVGGAMDLYGLYRGATHLPEDISNFVENPSWRNAGQIGLDALGIGFGGYTSAKQVIPSIKSGYNKVATGNSFIPYAWKSGLNKGNINPAYLGSKNFDALKSANLNKDEATLVNKYLYSPSSLTNEERNLFNTLVSEKNLGNQNINSPISRINDYHIKGRPYPTSYGSKIEHNKPVSWTVGSRNDGAGHNLAGNQRIVIPERYARNMGEDFFKMPYDDLTLQNVVKNNPVGTDADGTLRFMNIDNLVHERELLGMPRLKVIGRDNSGHFNDIIVKPVGNQPSFFKGLQSKGFFTPNTPASLGAGTLNMGFNPTNLFSKSAKNVDEFGVPRNFTNSVDDLPVYPHFSVMEDVGQVMGSRGDAISEFAMANKNWMPTKDNFKYLGNKSGRDFVQMNTPAGNMTFYKSTGRGGKAGSKDTWVPFEGFDKTGWFIKAGSRGNYKGRPIETIERINPTTGKKESIGVAQQLKELGVDPKQALRDGDLNLDFSGFDFNYTKNPDSFIHSFAESGMLDDALKGVKKYGGPKYPSGPYYPYKGDTLKVDRNYDKTHVQPFAFAHGGPHDPPKLLNTFSDFNDNIIVNDKNDPRYVNYQNHLKLYKNYKWLKDNIMTDKYRFPNHPEEGKLWNWKKYDSKNLPYPDFDIVTGEINTSPGGHGWRDAMADYIENWKATLKPWREDSADGFTTWGGNNLVLDVPYPEYEVTYKGLSPEEIERRRKAEELRIKQEEELRKQKELETIISNADQAYKNKQLLEQELLYEKPLSNIPEGYSLVKGDYDPAFGEYGNYYTSLTGEGKDIPFGKTKEDYQAWKNRDKSKYGDNSVRHMTTVSFKNGGNSVLLQVRDKLDRIKAAEKLLNKFKNARYGKV